MRTSRKKTDAGQAGGSALVLVILLTSLLAVVGVMFVMSARVDKIASTATTENKELDLAVDTIIGLISDQISADVPGMGTGAEYYDYPGPADPWLASLVPDVYNNGTPADFNDDIYYWKQISDVTGFLGPVAQSNVNLDPPLYNPSLNQKYINEYPEIELDINGNLVEQLADADGDGIADAKWIEVGRITSDGYVTNTTSKGEKFYAAVRVIDNSGMVNFNTAYRLDINDITRIDGSSQSQINLAAMVLGNDVVGEIQFARFDPCLPLTIFETDMVWPVDVVSQYCEPFDISDELDLRHRFCIDYKGISRVENLWNETIGVNSAAYKDEPFMGGPKDEYKTLEQWEDSILNPYNANFPQRRHFLTTMNTDRVINPYCDKMVNINNVNDVEVISQAILNGMDTKDYSIACRLAVNMRDFIDKDFDVTVYNAHNNPNDVNIVTGTYYGFDAQPFITEIGMQVVTVSRSRLIFYALELYNPFNKNMSLENFAIDILADPCSAVYHTVTFGSGDVIGANNYFVISNNPGAFNINPASVVKTDTSLRFFGNWQPQNLSEPPAPGQGPGPGSGPGAEPPAPEVKPKYNSTLLMKRNVGVSDWIYVDRQDVSSGWVPASGTKFLFRDIRDWHVAYQAMAEDANAATGRLGYDPAWYPEFGYRMSFFMPTGGGFVTIGDISRLLTIGNNTDPAGTIGQKLMEAASQSEAAVRIDYQNPHYRRIFQYLTVLDPANYGQPANETRVKGRININTAPWFVISQLPWVSDELAQAIVAYRDKKQVSQFLSIADYSDGAGTRGRFDGIEIKLDPMYVDIREDMGFDSTGELNFVIGGNDWAYTIDQFARDGGDLTGFPDLSPSDAVADDFEERDMVFSRISNLATVRSDLFTAYILVRLGSDGPQKRVIAILDRSEVSKFGGKVKVIALQEVGSGR